MIYNNKRSFFLIMVLCTLFCGLSLDASSITTFHQHGCRFYAAYAADLDGNGRHEIIAVGQIHGTNKKKYSVYIALFRAEDKNLTKYADFSFNVYLSGEKIPSRIRAIEILPRSINGEWHLFLTGRGGEEKNGVGFLFHAVIKNNKIIKRGEKTFQHAGAKATHGYPLSVADLDSDGKEEIIYGGFFIKNKKDWADVRVFKFKEGKLVEFDTPFKNLPIPLRVHAIDSGDLDGDGHVDIVLEDGKLSHHVFKEKKPCRLRTIKIMDLDGDKKNELVTGGRIEAEDLWLADLRLWKVKQDKINLLDRFCWSRGYKIRVRTITGVMGDHSHIKIGGRAAWQIPGGEIKWRGFIWEFSLDKGQLKPVQSPHYFDFGNDTRIRHLFLTDTGDLIASGFAKTKDKRESGFIFLIDSENQ